MENTLSTTKEAEQATNATKSSTFDVSQPAASNEPGGQNGPVEDKKEREEQERTKVKKRLFIEAYIRGKGIVSHACAKMEIDRVTFYQWKAEDPDFVKALEISLERQCQEYRDVLTELALIKKHAPSVHFWLHKRDPAFRERSITEVVVGEKTLEDVIADDEEELNKQNDTTDGEETTVESGTDPGPIENQGQAQDIAEVQTELGASPVLGKEDAPQPDPQSPAEGAK